MKSTLLGSWRASQQYPSSFWSYGKSIFEVSTLTVTPGHSSVYSTALGCLRRGFGDTVDPVVAFLRRASHRHDHLLLLTSYTVGPVFTFLLTLSHVIRRSGLIPRVELLRDTQLAVAVTVARSLSVVRPLSRSHAHGRCHFCTVAVSFASCGLCHAITVAVADTFACPRHGSDRCHMCGCGHFRSRFRHRPS